MSLRTWYDSLFVKAYPPVAAAVSGFAAGAGIPRSISEAGGMLAGFGEMLAGPTPEQQAEGMKPLIEGMKAIPAAAKQDPWKTGGYLAGMAMGGIGPEDVPKLGKIVPKAGKRQMSPNERVLRERARIHRELEGKKTPMRIGDTWIFPEGTTKGAIPITSGAESFGDELAQLRSLPDATLLRAHKEARSAAVSGGAGTFNLGSGFVGSSYDKAFLREITRRGLRPDLSDELHLLHEGAAGPMFAETRTAELGNKIRGYKAGFSPEALASQREAAEALKQYVGEQHLDPNMFITREERGAKMLQKSGVEADLGYGLPARAESMEGIPGLKGVPSGRTAMYAGDRWLKTSRGWTRVGGRPGAKDFDWLLKQHFDVKMEQPPELRGVLDDITGSRPEAVVHEIKAHGGWAGLPTDIEARRVVAKHVRQRAALGKAQANEIVWLNLHDMKMQRYKR
jgi:hypothetical protein